MRFLKVAAAMVAAACLAACATPRTDTADLRARVQSALATIDTAYAGAKLVMLVYCGKAPAAYPCRDPAAMEIIRRSGDLLDLAIVRARADVEAAKDATAVQLAIRAALDAVAIYMRVVSDAGVK